MFVLEKFDKDHHDRSKFSCANPILTEYLQKHARKDSENNYCSIYVAILDTEKSIKNKIYGYFTLSSASIKRDNFFENEKYSSISGILIGRLAIQEDQKLLRGYELLGQALITCKKISTTVGARIVLVDAKDNHSKRFYLKQGFIEIPNHHMRLFYPIKSIEDN
jgi:ribosomal protein S17E